VEIPVDGHADYAVRGNHGTLRVKDVDTLHGDLQLPWSITLRAQDIRLDFDGLEVSRIRRGVVITDDEIVRGKQAKAALEKMISQCQAAYLQPVAQPGGGFDRIAGSLWLQFPEQTALVSVRAWAQQWQYLRSP
jgi:hypothetical protein